MHVPSISQCLEFFDRYEMLDNIRAHSFVVARVAETLLNDLHQCQKTKAPLPKKNETIAGALMHDIAKTLCLENGCLHAEQGRKICEELGYPELGEIVAEHVLLSEFNTELYMQGSFGPKEIVYYSDKRVRHDQIVSLAERLDYILERYGDNNPAKEERIRQNFRNTQIFEKHLFAFLSFPASELEQHISHKPFLHKNVTPHTNL